MGLADTSEMLLGYIEETNWGTTPSTPELTGIRATGESLKGDIKTVVSNEVRGDRQIPDLAVVGGGAGGGFKCELSFGEYDKFLQHALMADPSVVQTITGTDLALTGATITSAALAFVAAKNKVGQWIKIGGSGTSGNNGIYKIVTSTTGTLTLQKTDGTAASFTNDSANAALTYSSSVMLRNGVIKKSMTLEKGFSSVGKYFQYAGMRVSQFSLDLGVKNIITGGFDFMGKGVATTGATIDNAGGYTASQVNGVMNASQNLPQVLEGGSIPSGRSYKSLNFQLNNSLREQDAVGSASLVGIGVGRCNVTGNAEMYFNDTDAFAKFIAGTATSLVWIVKDASGNYYIFTFPNVKFSSASIEGGGADQDVMQKFGWQALRDPVTDCTIQIDKI